MAPMPEQWMTLDSLVSLVGISEAQKPQVQPHYDAINVVMKKAADERRKMREQMMAGGGPPTEEQRTAMRETAQKLQAELDQHYHALRVLLSPDQQAKLDSLPKPQAMMMRRRMG